MRHFPVLSLVATGLALLVGCSHSTPTAVPASAPLGDLAPLTTATGPDQLAGLWDLAVDPEALSATLSRAPERVAASRPPQTLNFDIDLTHLVSPSALELVRVGRDGAGDLVITWRHRHPLPAVDLTQPASAINRADLGYSGRLLVLVEDQVESFFDNSIRLDPSFVQHPHGFLNAGDLLAHPGSLANTFPYLLLVNEAEDNREQVSNHLSPTGNYDSATGGWQRANLGATGDQWTGYDYLHAGQSTLGTLTLNQARLLAGPVRVRLALLVKYSDPKGSATIISRLPSEASDPLAFAYRLPYAALDCSQLHAPSSVTLGLATGSNRRVSVTLRDWDARAFPASQPDLSLESDVSLIQPGAMGSPQLDLDCPAVRATPLILDEVTSGSGTSANPIGYSGVLTNDLGTAPAGTVWALIRAVDPEDGDPLASEYRFGLDPRTLTPSAARALRVRTYQPIAIDLRALTPGSTFAHRWGGFSTINNLNAIVADPEGNLYVGGYIAANGNQGTPSDLDPSAGEDFEAVVGPGDSFLASFAPDGTYRWGHRWGNDAVNNVTGEAISALAFDPLANELVVAGRFMGTLDLDPGPGTFERTSPAFQAFHTYISRFTPEGTFLTAASFGATERSMWCMPYGLALDTAGHVFATGTFQHTVDFDPGPGEVLRTAQDHDCWLVELDPALQLVRCTTFGSELSEFVYDLELTSDGVLLTGIFRDTDFDPGAAIAQRTAVGLYANDAFLLRLSRTGAFQWVRTWGDPTDYKDVTAVSVATNSTGDIAVTGSFNGPTTDFDPGPATHNRAAAYQSDGYLLSLDPAGEYRWAQTWDGPFGDYDRGSSVAADASDQWLVGGSATPGDGDASYLKFDQSGTVVWEQVITAFESGSTTAIYPLEDGGLCVLAQTDGQTDLDPGPGEDWHNEGAVPLMVLLRVNTNGLRD